jgi:osmotically-inducible protein OsmY
MLAIERQFLFDALHDCAIIKNALLAKEANMSVYTEKLRQETGNAAGAPSVDSASRGVASRSATSGSDTVDDDSPSDREAQSQLGPVTQLSPESQLGSAGADDVPDVDVEESARVRLQHSPYRAIRRVGCIYSDGTLTLSGVVPTYHYKQLAQTAVSEIAGVQRVVNQIDVG